VQCCSGSACAAADRQFGPQSARRDLERYHRKGPDPSTRALLAGVRAVMPAGGSLLDVGGGVGVITFELLANNVAQATLVDGSSSYIDAAGREAEGLGHSARIRLVNGDFTAVADGIETADIVTMHRVVCCFPRYDALIGTASARCRQVLAFSYPHDRWYIRAWVRLDNLRRRVFRNPFRTFVHPPAEMHAILEGSGFVRVSRKQTAVWCVDVYRRTVTA
jgi:2-polyprenyl-3-methyl-5-hydroxy-6-metoxy-1,4-benzoquinol methylase